MKRAVIKLENVWKTYKMGEVEVNALRGLDLEILEQDFLAVQGPSGSGKSTALNMIGALDYPSKGRILLDGKDISKMSESNLAQVRGKKVGFVFQQFNLIPTFSAKENVMLPMLFQGMSKEQRETRAVKLLERMDMGQRLDHKPSELSGGQQQRVAIARSLANNPEVILADEPTGNLDSKTGAAVMQMLKDLNEKEGKTVIMITHDTNLAKSAKRIEFIKDGKIVSRSEAEK